jgi:glycosyltransferase involved in cell wall biosynthesis
MTVLLTIIVPTFNRLELLTEQVHFLLSEIEGRTDVELLVVDNCSDYDPSVLQNMFRAASSVNVHRQGENIGPDRNFMFGVRHAAGSYVWLLGDDDRPACGLIDRLCAHLVDAMPDLCYLPSRWSAALPDPVPACQDVKFLESDAESWLKIVHVWVTFISGIVVRRNYVEEPIGRFVGSNLVQLEWTYRALTRGTKFTLASKKCVFAMSGNTGGYSALEVFGGSFPTISFELLPERLARSVVSRVMWTYFPQLVLGCRMGTLGQFEKYGGLPSPSSRVRSSIAFWSAVVPAAKVPLSLAIVVRVPLGILVRLWACLDAFQLRRLETE